MNEEIEELRKHAQEFERTHCSVTEGSCDEAEQPIPTLSESADREHLAARHLEGDAKMWAVHGLSYFPCESTVPTLPPGQYSIAASDTRGIFFNKHNVCLDELIVLPDSASEEIFKGMEYFWQQEAAFRKFGFLWQRGVLLWGPAGSGKTSLVQLLSKKIVELGGFSVYVNCPDIDARGLALLRRIEPKRPIVVIIEDIDAIIRRYNEATVLALFDGELQIDNAVYLATTNYPGRLDPRIINRPSRFDVVKKIGMPSAESRRVYLQHKHPSLTEDQLDLWVGETEDFSFAHLKEVIVAVECLGQRFEETINRLRSMMEIDKLPEYGEDYKKKHELGFGSNGALKETQYIQVGRRTASGPVLD